MGWRYRVAALGLLTLMVLCGPWLSSADAHTRGAESPVASVGPVPLASDGRSVAPALPSVPPLPAVPPKGTIDGVLLLIVAALLCLVRWPARTAQVLLALLVVVVGVEGAVHSVHHLGSPQGSKSCTVLSVTQQLPGETSPEPPSGVPAARLHQRHQAPAASHEVAPSARHSDRKRAPPFPLA